MKLSDIKGVTWPELHNEDFTSIETILNNSFFDKVSKIKSHEFDPREYVFISKKDIISILKKLLLTPRILDKRPSIEELNKILNSDEGTSLAILPNGEIACLNPKVDIEAIATAIAQSKDVIKIKE